MKVCIFGASGLAGRGISMSLSKSKHQILILEPDRGEVDLKKFDQVLSYLEVHKPEIVIMAAGKVGGIQYNTDNQLSQYSQNLLINENVINVCAILNIERLILLSSSCIYPKNLSTPMSEEQLFNGLPEASNEGYALAKITSLRHLLLRRRHEGRDWSAVVPTNLYGEVPHFLNDDHVIPMMIKKLQNIGDSNLQVWGDGSPKRQFLHNEDLGSAILFLLDQESLPEIVNVAPTQTVTILELVQTLSKIMGFDGKIQFDRSRPNGHPDKSISGHKMTEIGWESKIELAPGLENLVKYVRGLRVFESNGSMIPKCLG